MAAKTGQRPLLSIKRKGRFAFTGNPIRLRELRRHIAFGFAGNNVTQERDHGGWAHGLTIERAF